MFSILKNIEIRTSITKTLNMEHLLISFKTAKLLKENNIVHDLYSGKMYSSSNGQIINSEYSYNSDIRAPFRADLQRLFRTKYCIEIEILYILGGSYSPNVFAHYEKSARLNKNISIEHQYANYDDALEKALQIAIEFIKNNKNILDHIYLLRQEEDYEHTSNSEKIEELKECLTENKIIQIANKVELILLKSDLPNEKINELLEHIDDIKHMEANKNTANY